MTIVDYKTDSLIECSLCIIVSAGCKHKETCNLYQICWEFLQEPKTIYRGFSSKAEMWTEQSLNNLYFFLMLHLIPENILSSLIYVYYIHS